MKERPILFSDAMVRAILAGTKTQTRRAVKPQPARMTESQQRGRFFWFESGDEGNVREGRCPYGVPGDRLWVRETFSQSLDTGEVIWYWADGNPRDDGWTRAKPSIHMRRAHSRITLEIKSVRVERLHDISEADAIAEGIDWSPTMGGYNCAGEWRNHSVPIYRQLWESINGAGAWDANPWVWVIEFERVG